MIAREDIKPDDLSIHAWGSRRLSSWVHESQKGIMIIHLPTGTVITEESASSQHLNKDIALDRLVDAINAANQKNIDSSSKNTSCWLPIESAPKDGQVIDLWFGGWINGRRVPDCFWQLDVWTTKIWDGTTRCVDSCEDQTHWMSKPNGPGE